MNKAFVLIVLIILCGSCRRPYHFTNMNRKISNESLSGTDRLYVKDYIICNSLRDIKKNPIIPKGDLVLPINEDSVLACFQLALERAKVPVLFNQSRANFCDDEFHRNVRVRDRKINHQKIIEIAKNSPDSALVMVPIIYIDNVYEYRVMPSTSGFAFGGNIVKNVYLSVAVYLVRNEKIVFFRSARHYTNSNHESFDEEPFRQTQENGDKLVAMVMRDYLKRAQ